MNIGFLFTINFSNLALIFEHGCQAVHSFKKLVMPDSTFHIRINKEYAAALIEDLIKVHAVEAVEQEDEIELTTRQKEALDKELEAVAANASYLQRWDDVKSRFKRP